MRRGADATCTARSTLDGHHVEAAGRTDGAIARDLLLAAGLAPAAIDARADDVHRRGCALYDELCPADLSRAAWRPGVAGRCSPRWRRGPDAFRFSLVTGNFERDRAAQARAGGDRRLVPGGPGGFGSDAEDRERAAADRPRARRRLAARAHGRHRRHAARHRLRAGRRPARHRGRDRARSRVEALADADAVADGGGGRCRSSSWV